HPGGSRGSGMFSPLRGLVTFWRVFPALTRWANEFRRSAAGRGTVFSRVHSAVEKPPLLDKRLFRELFDGGSRRCTPCQLGWALLRCMAWWIRAEAEARLPRVDERWCLPVLPVPAWPIGLPTAACDLCPRPSVRLPAWRA